MDTTKPDPGAAEAVLQRPAVLVGAVVHEGHGELVQQVPPVHGVDLNAREAALLEKDGGGDHLVDLLPDLVLGEGGARRAGAW